MRRAVERYLEDPLAEEILKERISNDSTCRVILEGNGENLSFPIQKKTINDNTGTYTLAIKKHLKAKAADGVELYDGLVDTEEQREELDELLLEKLEELEGTRKSTIDDNTGSYTLTTKKYLKADGVKLYDGLVDTEEQREELDELLLEKLEELEGIQKRTINDNIGSYTLTINKMFNFSGLATPTSEKQLEAKDAEGNELYNGPVDTEEQREELDAFLLEKLEELEGIRKTINDNTGSYTLTINDSKKHLKAEDAEGNELYDGPVETDEQREELDAFLLEKLEELEGQLEGLQTSKAVSI
jgi:ribosomal protein L5